MGSMTVGERENLMDQIEQFLPTLAAHHLGFKVVVEMVQHFQGMLLDRVVRIRRVAVAIPVCRTACLTCPLAMPRELQQNAAVSTHSKLQMFAMVAHTPSNLLVFLFVGLKTKRQRY